MSFIGSADHPTLNTANRIKMNSFSKKKKKKSSDRRKHLECIDSKVPTNNSNLWQKQDEYSWRSDNLPCCAADHRRCQLRLMLIVDALNWFQWTWIWVGGKKKNLFKYPRKLLENCSKEWKQLQSAKVRDESVQEMICEFHQRADWRG